MHYLQQHILKSLILGGSRRFGEMKPPQVEGNRFTYHLRAVMRAGYVSAHAGAYILTPKGKRYAEGVSLNSFRESVQPRIVSMLVAQNKKGEYLLYRRKRMPLRTMVSFPYGKVHVGERYEAAAARELEEKTGLKGKAALRGSMYLCLHDEEELVSHMLCHVFLVTGIHGETRKDMLAGECFWGRIENVRPRFLLPGTKQVVKLLASRKPNFFAEYFLDVHEEPFDSA
jgi:ADP-ribose pyrophosphatase YjhB (NUDIX family)